MASVAWRTPPWNAVYDGLVATVDGLFKGNARSGKMMRLIDATEIVVQMVAVWAVEVLPVVAVLPVSDVISTHTSKQYRDLVVLASARMVKKRVQVC
jgi:hypothetical protein